MDIPQVKLICGSIDGSVSSLTYVDEPSFKRLHLLQGQLLRTVQHVAALNPKAFRMVRNDHVSRPLSKGILDGNLLATFEDLPVTRQNEVTRQIGTDRATILKDWSSFGRSPCRDIGVNGLLAIKVDRLNPFWLDFERRSQTKSAFSRYDDS
ncbi:hypothetical protein A0H81_02690 [Grifola frondosa]|uniref:RSE1/DDB1/CPSF1 C-terminal domain-containing protein n=1 Tax=Grifola frondosa TaxID=5627 RepID=A0A1C7MK94_GRIFR|nr:hypothetical protein A0H81_02690 [Grifola frondosa]